MGATKIFVGLLLNITLALMCLYIYKLPYLPFKQDPTKVHHELPNNRPLQLLDLKTGLLNHEGWAKFPNKLLYNPDMHKSYVPLFARQKHWNYFYIISEGHLVTMAHLDIGLVKASYVNIRDIKDMSKPMIQVKVEDFLGQSVHIDCAKNGQGIESSISHERLNMTFFRRPEETTTKINLSGATEKEIISGKFTTDAQGLEGISHAISFPENPLRHTVKYKLPLLKFNGSLTVNGKSIISCSDSKPCLGLLDNTRGFFPYSTSWIWGSTCFTADKKNIALNLASSSDNPNSSFDALFINGKLYKLDPMVMTKVSDEHWKWTSNPEVNQHKETILEVEFHKSHTHSLGANYLLIESDLQSNFGHFSGKIKTQDGHSIQFKDVFGFVEDFHARW